MSRLTQAEGIKRFFASSYPSSLLPYTEELHEEVKDFTTGLVGACLKLRLPSLSAPEMGSPLPFFVTMVSGDLIRIVVDPIFQPYKEKGQDHMAVSALAHTGEMMVLDTLELSYLNWTGLLQELQYQYNIFTSLGNDSSVPS